jgi:thiamine pyrophosphokinase
MNGNGICFIIGAGEYYGHSFVKEPGDFIICADGGLDNLARYNEQEKPLPLYQPIVANACPALNLTCELLIGDFDSLERIPEGIEVIQLSKEKDETDTFAAVQEGIKRGYTRFHFYCCTGGRIDHTLANIQMLAWLAERKLQGVLFDRDSVLTAVKDGCISFTPRESGYISVFSLSEESTGVNLRGLKYPLTDATVTNTFPIGVSNEFTGKESSVSVEHGTLLIIIHAPGIFAPNPPDNCA